jgi:hypothetical protein
MTQAYNLSQLANKVNTSGQVDVTTGLSGVTPVANGGTGQSTFTNGQLLIGNTTGNTLTKATLTEGIGISITNGNGSITIATTGGGQLSYALFSSGSGTWTCPSGVTKVKVTCIAGGGGGNAAGIGGFGGCAIGIYAVTPGTSYAYSVGAGGAGASGTTTASNGASSSVTGLCSATGGKGAAFATAYIGTNGVGSNGTFYNQFMGNVNLTTSTNPGYGTLFYDFIGIYMFSGKVKDTGTTAAVSWSSSSLFCPGSPGYGAIGGVGGVILIEYIG